MKPSRNNPTDPRSHASWPVKVVKFYGEIQVAILTTDRAGKNPLYGSGPIRSHFVKR